MYCQTIRIVRDISRDDRARIATGICDLSVLEIYVKHSGTQFYHVKCVAQIDFTTQV